jgi:putative membrane protein
MPILIRLIVVALSLWLAAYFIPGFRVEGWGTLILASLLFGIVSAIVKPVLVFLTFPITVLTLGLFLIVINAAMLGLVAWLLPGFSIDGFWSAVWGWLVVTVVGWVAARFTSDS